MDVGKTKRSAKKGLSNTMFEKSIVSGISGIFVDVPLRAAKANWIAGNSSGENCVNSSAEYRPVSIKLDRSSSLISGRHVAVPGHTVFVRPIVAGV